jgi:hypothetical protein
MIDYTLFIVSLALRVFVEYLAFENSLEFVCVGSRRFSRSFVFKKVVDFCIIEDF